jgi:hypothetical protein
MIQREVTDREGTKWNCVQAYTGLQGKLADKAAELAETDEGKIPVVCTPTGGAQSVRLEVKENWYEQLSDDALVEAIVSQKS